MASTPKRRLLPAEGNMLVLAPGALAIIGSYAGPNRVNLGNTGAVDADEEAMQFNILGTIGT
jgi:hypothetical protein